MTQEEAKKIIEILTEVIDQKVCEHFGAKPKMTGVEFEHRFMRTYGADTFIDHKLFRLYLRHIVPITTTKEPNVGDIIVWTNEGTEWQDPRDWSMKFKVEVVDELPLKGEAYKIYLVAMDITSEDNRYKEYVWTDEGWECLGELQVKPFGGYYWDEEEELPLIEKRIEEDYYDIKNLEGDAVIEIGEVVCLTNSSKDSSAGGKIVIEKEKPIQLERAILHSGKSSIQVAHNAISVVIDGDDGSVTYPYTKTRALSSYDGDLIWIDVVSLEEHQRDYETLDERITIVNDSLATTKEELGERISAVESQISQDERLRYSDGTPIVDIEKEEEDDDVGYIYNEGKTMSVVLYADRISLTNLFDTREDESPNTVVEAEFLDSEIRMNLSRKVDSFLEEHSLSINRDYIELWSTKQGGSSLITLNGGDVEIQGGEGSKINLTNAGEVKIHTKGSNGKSGEVLRSDGNGCVEWGVMPGANTIVRCNGVAFTVDQGEHNYYCSMLKNGEIIKNDLLTINEDGTFTFNEYGVYKIDYFGALHSNGGISNGESWWVGEDVRFSLEYDQGEWVDHATGLLPNINDQDLNARNNAFLIWEYGEWESRYPNHRVVIETTFRKNIENGTDPFNVSWEEDAYLVITKIG